LKHVNNMESYRNALGNDGTIDSAIQQLSLYLSSETIHKMARSKSQTSKNLTSLSKRRPYKVVYEEFEYQLEKNKEELLIDGQQMNQLKTPSP
jgi:hypothetical protein